MWDVESEAIHIFVSQISKTRGDSKAKSKLWIPSLMMEDPVTYLSRKNKTCGSMCTNAKKQQHAINSHSSIFLGFCMPSANDSFNGFIKFHQHTLEISSSLVGIVGSMPPSCWAAVLQLWLLYRIRRKPLTAYAFQATINAPIIDLWLWSKSSFDETRICFCLRGEEKEEQERVIQSWYV